MDLKSLTANASKAARIAMVLVVLLTAVFLVVVIAEGIGTLLVTRKANRQAEPSGEMTEQQVRAWIVSRSIKAFLADGTVHLMEDAGSGRECGQLVRIYDADLKQLWAGRRPQVPYDYLRWADRAGSARFASGRPVGFYAIQPDFSRTLAVPVVPVDRKAIERWAYEPSERCFVGHDLKGNAIGRAGLKGFVQPGSTPTPFGEFRNVGAWCPKGTSTPTLLWQTDHRLSQIDFERRTVEVLFDVADERIATVAVNRWYGTEGVGAAGRPFVAAITRRGRCHVRLRRPDERMTVDLPDGCNPLQVNLAFADGKLFLRRQGTDAMPPPVHRHSSRWRQWDRDRIGRPRKHWVQLDRFGPDGKPSRVGRFEWTTVADPKAVAMQRRLFERYGAVRHCVTLPSPPVAEGIWRLYIWSIPEERTGWWGEPRVNEVAGEIAGRFVPASRGACWLVSLLLAALAGWHALPRRRSWPWLVGWVVFVAALNLAGFLTYLALNHTPVIRCGACGRRRGLTTPHCPACRAALAPPPPKDCDDVLIKPCPS